MAAVFAFDGTGSQVVLPLFSFLPFTFTNNPPAIVGQFASATYSATMHGFHVVVPTIPGVVGVDLWFVGPPGGADTGTWDGQTTTFIQFLGTAQVNGTVTFPGSTSPTLVSNWGGSAETQFGNVEFGPGPIPITGIVHIGFDYAVSHNPDGSNDVLDVVAEQDGVWRGILSHVDASGTVAQCEPSVRLFNWQTDLLTGFQYPLSVSASCGSLSHTWTTTAAHTIVVPYGLADGFLNTNSAAVSDVPGSTAFMQHQRDVGFTGQTP